MFGDPEVDDRTSEKNNYFQRDIVAPEDLSYITFWDNLGRKIAKTQQIHPHVG